MKTAVVIGAGPAGLMAAHVMVQAGISVTVVDAKPSFGRKFLMAGKSGLNVTKDEPMAAFLASYPLGSEWLTPHLQSFGPGAVQDWVTELGQEVFTGSSGRVFPTSMKASPLLRAWLDRLSTSGVIFRKKWNWTGWRDGGLVFGTPSGEQVLEPNATVFAMGGASWGRLGSTGEWSTMFDRAGIPLTPFAPSNMGFDVEWSDYMRPYFGQPVKPLRLSADTKSISGEIVISKTGIEGGGIYTLSAALRGGALLTLDLCPDISAQILRERLAKQSKKATRASLLRKAFGLNKIKVALVNEVARNTDDLVAMVKALPIPLAAPRPIDEAISTAGGVAQTALTNDLMLVQMPGTFCAGEMLDWDAPTGGYLITACLATGRAAGLGAVKYLG